MLTLLLLSTSMINIGDAETGTNTIYVDDDNTEGPWLGTKDQPYCYLDDALDVAENGNTIFVCNGTYYGKFRVNKSIILQGEDNRNTFLWEECFYVVYVYSNDVEISGFTILGNYSTQSGICLEATNGHIIKNVSIHDNRIIHNRAGIQSIRDAVSNIQIYDNEIIGNNYGIYLKEGNLIRIFRNSISGNRNDGIYISGENNEIKENLISYNNENGIRHDGNNITIHQNEILGNEQDGIQCSSSFNGTISNNLISDNYHGICFLKNSMGNSIVTRNYLITNQIGLLADKTDSDLDIFRNEISRNEIFGLVIFKKINGEIKENNFIDNGKDNLKCLLPLIKRHALFIGIFRFSQSPFDSNYWDNYNGEGNYHIPAIGFFPGLLKDIHPTTSPYSIEN